MIVVVDTNVLVSAFLTAGLTRQAFLAILEQDLVVSPQILREFRRVLEKKLKASEERAGRAIRFVETACRVVEPVGEEPTICRDADDNHVLLLASAAKADYLLTGDSDLLMLKRYARCRVVSPRDLVELLEKKRV